MLIISSNFWFKVERRISIWYLKCLCNCILRWQSGHKLRICNTLYEINKNTTDICEKSKDFVKIFENI